MKQTHCRNLAVCGSVVAAIACGAGSATPAAQGTTTTGPSATSAAPGAMPPAAEAPASATDAARATASGIPREPRQWSVAELKQLPQSDMEREWSAHTVAAIPVGCSHDAVEITYDARGVPSDTTKPIWTGKCIDAKTKIPANIIGGVRKDATDRPATIKPSFFDGKDAVVFEYPGQYSLHLRELGPGLYLGRQARESKATGVVYIVGRFAE